jgi:cell division protein FtsQ
MARKSPTISQEELYPPEEEFAREEIDDARLLDLDVEKESPFLRGQKRVSARRSSLPQQAAVGLKWTLLTLTVILLGSITVGALYHYGEHSWRFRVESSDDIEITGSHNVTHSQIMEVMGGDIGRNIFFIPLAQRKAQLEQIPWVESASIMRFVPSRLKIEIYERTPVAFARIGPRIWLVDAGGTLMELPSTAKKKFSFPVLLGMNAGEPLSTRSARMKIYNELMHELDSGGAHYSQELSEVDLSDPDDVKVTVANPSGEVLIHLGSSNYLDRYKVFVAHLQEWRQQFDKLQSVDLRYDRQIVVNPDLRGTAKQMPLSATAAKAAISAGVKPAALVKRESSAPNKPAGTLVTKSWTKPPLKSGWKKKRSHWTRRGNRYVARNSALSTTTSGPTNWRPAVNAVKPSDSRMNAKPVQVAPPPAPDVRQHRIANRANVLAKPETIKPGSTTNKKPSPGIPRDQDHP